MSGIDSAKQREELETLLQELGSKMGIGAVEMDASGVARLVFDGATILDLQWFGESAALGMMISIQELPEECDAKTLRAFLAAPLSSGLLTPGVFPALDSRSGEVLLMRVVGLSGLSADALASDMEALLECAEKWQSGVPTETIAQESDDKLLHAISI